MKRYACGLFGLVHGCRNSLPAELDTSGPDVRSILIDREGNVVGTLAAAAEWDSAAAVELVEGISRTDSEGTFDTSDLVRYERRSSQSVHSTLWLSR